MNRQAKPSPAADDDRAKGADQHTPSTDMQPEDTGTPESGNSGGPTAAEKAMKQTSKTQAEQGRKG
jgi:hypothetical protein